MVKVVLGKTVGEYMYWTVVVLNCEYNGKVFVSIVFN